MTALAQPASQALTPQTIPAAQRRAANVLLRLGINSAAMVGAAAGSALVAWIGSGWGLAADAASFGAAAIMFAMLDAALRRGAARSADVGAASGAASGSAGPMPPRRHLLRELLDGWREFTAREWVWVIVLQFMVVNMCFSGGVSVLGPVIADESFGRAQWGLVLAAETLGLVIGGFVAMRWHPRHPRHPIGTGVALILLSALPLFALGARPQVPLLIVLFLVAGIGVEQFEVAWDQSLQHHVPQDRLSRVYSYDQLGSFAAIPLGQLIAGPLAGLLGARAVLIAASVLVLLVTLAALSRRSVRTVTNA